MNDMATTNVITYDMIKEAKEHLMCTAPTQEPTVIMGKGSFDYCMLIAKHYAGKQIIKRNRYNTSKKNRYRKTYIAPSPHIVSDTELMMYGVRHILNVFQDECLAVLDRKEVNYE